jgi:hypothetical protein
MQTYQVGQVECDITPPVGVTLAGYAGRTEPSEGVYLPLTATVTVIDDGQTPVVLIAAEFISFCDLSPALRGRINELTGINGANVLMSASHTHTGPATGDFYDILDTPADWPYLNGVVEKFAQCAKQAYDSRQPMVLRYGVGRSDLAMQRRKPDPDNPPRVFRSMLPNPGGPVDHDVPVLAAYTPGGELKHVLVSYACHPTSRGGLLIGGDYVGFALEYIRQQRPGIPVGFLQGCGGDQKVRPVDRNAPSFGGREIDQTRDAGYELGKVVIDLLDRDELQTIDGPIAVSQTMMQLTAEPPNEQAVSDNLTSDNPWCCMWAKRMRAFLDGSEPIDRTAPFEVQTIRFGDALAICPMPGEMSVEYSLRLKRDLGEQFKHVLPLGYANGMVGYVSSKRQFPEYGYEVWDSNMFWFRTGRWEEDTEGRIVATVCDGLARK